MASLFVSNLDYEVTEQDLRDLFSKVGEVRSIKIIKDRETGRSRGFAFVELGSEAEVKAAIHDFHRQPFHGRPIVVDVAKQRSTKQP